jgi:hypothetical protein
MKHPALNMGKNPNPNIQAPEKFQAPSNNANRVRWFEAWSLVFLWMLELGCWSFLSYA